MSDPDATLLAALRAGDPSAAAAVVRRHGPAMLAAARRVLAHEEDAREALQDAFLQAFRALPSFAGESALGTWLYRVALNAALTKLRTRKRHPETPIGGLLPAFGDDEHHLDPPAAWPEPPAAALERAETRDLVRSAIGRLPESYRTVLVLRDIEGVDTAAAADRLGVSEGLVKTRLHRARQALRALLDPHLRGGVP